VIHHPLRRHLRCSGAAVIVLWAMTAAACSSDSSRFQVTGNEGAVTHEFVIPAGTAERTARGETVNVVPERLDVKVGDTLRIRNEDVSSQEVGIFNVGAGETVTMKFTTPGKLSGECTIHPSGAFTIQVHDA
jgi:plastocyanin